MGQSTAPGKEELKEGGIGTIPKETLNPSQMDRLGVTKSQGLQLGPHSSILLTRQTIN